MADTLAPPNREGPISFFMRVRKLAWMERGNDQFRFYHQTVADHSFFITLIATWIVDEENKLLGEDEQLDRALVMEKALFHDIPESQVGDLSYRVKKMSKTLEAEFNKVEEEVVRTTLFDGLPQDLRDKYAAVILENQDSEEARIVKYSDMVEALIWSFIELKAGNKHFQEIWTNGLGIMYEKLPYKCARELLRSMQWEMNS